MYAKHTQAFTSKPSIIAMSQIGLHPFIKIADFIDMATKWLNTSTVTLELLSKILN